MAMTESGDSYSVVRTTIHLCEECGEPFEPGQEVVSITDGHVNRDEEYDTSNRWFWHYGCFPESARVMGGDS